MTIRFVDSACNTLDAELALQEGGEFSVVNVYVCRLADEPNHGYLLEVDVADDGNSHWGDDDCPGSAGAIMTWFGKGERFDSAKEALEALYGTQEPIADLEFLDD